MRIWGTREEKGNKNAKQKLGRRWDEVKPSLLYTGHAKAIAKDKSKAHNYTAAGEPAVSQFHAPGDTRT